MTDDTHACPGPNCQRRIPYHMLACARHWARVPRHIQRRVYAAWRRGAGAGTPEHTAALEDAIAAMRDAEREAHL